MNNDIKEILEALKPHNKEFASIKEYPLALSVKEQKILLDYITNLQEENNYYFKKNNELSTLNTSLRSDRDIYKQRNEKAREKLEGIRIFGLRSGKTLFSTLINETIDILKGDKDE